MFFDELSVQDIGEGGETGWNHHPHPQKQSCKKDKETKEARGGGIKRKKRKKRLQLLKELGGEVKEERGGEGKGAWPWPFMAWPWLCPCLFHPLASIVETVYDN